MKINTLQRARLNSIAFSLGMSPAWGTNDLNILELWIFDPFTQSSSSVTTSELESYSKLEDRVAACIAELYMARAGH